MATRITRTSGAMRKAPKQARSRATIDAILDAAAHILGERGWSAFTTNAVAEAAGVSIGSLYQYFPDKLALIDAVRRRHFDDVLAVLQAAANPQIPRTRRIAALVDGMIAVHSRHPAAHRVLMEESPRGDTSRSAHDRFEIECRKAYEALFMANAGGTPDHVRLAAQVLAGALAGAVHEAARQGQLASPVLRWELVTLVHAYLSRARPVKVSRPAIAPADRV
ncbi:TetR/AcrR family transcriptional regulator [Paraburkholderia sp. CNPSo 3274]|uniref:TetR/AcrR family transcriptional regulator n=1 Tax=Paraburkholderia sp. CNPSo 3274 TaxID=2940932 RepID=UPI0020B7AD6C|nr:TetR/AcrR family transcriptional regulator [Paraburkholderia sp. CNPSo 3274]MCP3707743.1 TetR/AcrR family transcriptional regulator [Paraburkholderia sp. CNPSo 3274]